MGVNGSFVPKGKVVAELFAALVPHPPIIVEEIGRGELGKVARTREALFRVADEIEEFAPRTLVLSTPHNTFIPGKIGVLTGDPLAGSFAPFGFPEGEHQFVNDLDLVKAMLAEPELSDFLSSLNSGELDHGALVFLDFLRRRGGDAKLVVLTASHGELDAFWRFGQALGKLLRAQEGRFVYVSSGDLSHCTRATPGRHYHAEGPEFDRIVMEAVRSASAEQLLKLDTAFVERAEQCGLYSFLVSFGLLAGESARGEVLSYEDPFGVGYLVGTLRPE